MAAAASRAKPWPAKTSHAKTSHAKTQRYLRAEEREEEISKTTSFIYRAVALGVLVTDMDVEKKKDWFPLSLDLSHDLLLPRRVLSRSCSAHGRPA